MDSNIQTLSEQEIVQIARRTCLSGAWKPPSSLPSQNQASLPYAHRFHMCRILKNPGERWTCTEIFAPFNMFSFVFARWIELMRIAELLCLCITHLLSMFKGTALPSREGSQFLVKETSAWFSSWYMMRNSVPLILHKNVQVQIHLGSFFSDSEAKCIYSDAVVRTELRIERALTHQRCQFSALVGSKQGPSTWQNMQQVTLSTLFQHQFCMDKQHKS